MSMTSDEIRELAGKVLMNTYGARYELALVRGEGINVYDPEGNEYLDFLAGLAVTSLGHVDPAVTRAVCEQAARLVHVSNLYFTEPQVKLAKLLTDHCFADRVFFCNSGAEANEAAIKLARKYSFEKYGSGRFKVLSMEDSFHGRTMATLAATAQRKIHQGFEPLMEGFAYLPLGDASVLDEALTDDVCAVIIEPIQGEGGVNEPGSDYLRDLAARCREKDILVIFDEVQVGLGRTGKLFAHQHFQVEPDIMTLAKALANGLPMGACLARENVAQAFGPGSHATTFGGTPLVSAAALATLEQILSPGFLEKATETGLYFKEKLEGLKNRHSYIHEVRGLGLILGMELIFPGAGVVSGLKKRGFLINCTHDRVLRFLPPLIVTSEDIDRLLPALDEVLAIEAAANKVGS